MLLNLLDEEAKSCTILILIDFSPLLALEQVALTAQFAPTRSNRVTLPKRTSISR